MSIIKIKQNHLGEYILEDGRMVSFEPCNLGLYKGKLFMVSTDGKTQEVTNIIKYTEIPKFHTDDMVKILEEIEISDTSYSFTEVFFNMSREGQFFIGSSPVFSGYTFERKWNGFECPYFTKETFLKICQQFSYSYDEEGECRCFYDEMTDAFYCEDFQEDYRRERIGMPVEINTPAGRVKVYYFEGSWTWEEK